MRENIMLNALVLINYVHLNETEKKLIYTWRNHPDIRQWMYQGHEILWDEHVAYLKRLEDDSRNYCWLVKHNKQRYLGMISLNKIDSSNRNAYLGIYANPVEKIPGAGAALMQSLQYVAFSVFKLHTLKLEVLTTNENAIRFYHKSGFQDEGLLKEYVFKNNRWIDVVIMGLTASQD